MDDSLDSVETVGDGIQLYRELDSLWGIAGMQARKWISNSTEVIAATPVDERATELQTSEGQEPVVKTLGISWNSVEDTFTISTAKVSRELHLTRQNVLRKIATIFDPFGFVGPFVVKAKILIQELWSRGYDLDDTIQDDIAVRIEEWHQQGETLENVRVPRCLRDTKEVINKRIITFVDASLQAYGTVVYLQCVYNDGSVTSRLIALKNKVALLKPMTVPRLELMGAVLGLRLTQHLVHILEVPIQTVTFYSDSTDVLWWVRGHGRSFRPFVANRIGEIQMATDLSQWQHVATGENPADLCTRGATPEELSGSSFWWNGPTWLLSEDKANWPKMDVRSRPTALSETKKLKHKEETEGVVNVLTCCVQRRALQEKKSGKEPVCKE